MSLNSLFKVAFFILSFGGLVAHGEVIFEGYYRIEKKNKHFGYLIQRLEREPKSKNKTITTYIRTIPKPDTEVYEVFKSTAQASTGTPVKSIYDSTVSGLPIHIVGNFSQKPNQVGTGTAIVQYNRARKPASVRAVSKVQFSDSFLFYLADFAKMVKGKVYTYRSYAEERGTASIGHIDVVGENKNKAHVFQVVDDYLGLPLESFVAATGEPLGSRSPAENFVAYWVPLKDDAIGTLSFPKEELVNVFGDIPDNKKNPWSKLENFDALQVIKGFSSSYGSRAQGSHPKQSLPLPLRRI